MDFEDWKTKFMAEDINKVNIEDQADKMLEIALGKNWETTYNDFDNLLLTSDKQLEIINKGDCNTPPEKKEKIKKLGNIVKKIKFIAPDMTVLPPDTYIKIFWSVYYYGTQLLGCFVSPMEEKYDKSITLEQTAMTSKFRKWTGGDGYNSLIKDLSTEDKRQQAIVAEFTKRCWDKMSAVFANSEISEDTDKKMINLLIIPKSKLLLLGKTLKEIELPRLKERALKLKERALKDAVKGQYYTIFEITKDVNLILNPITDKYKRYVRPDNEDKELKVYLKDDVKEIDKYINTKIDVESLEATWKEKRESPAVLSRQDGLGKNIADITLGEQIDLEDGGKRKRRKYSTKKRKIKKARRRKTRRRNTRRRKTRRK
tara:strand:+ start:290 stop:1405 length:1116 start_codon:yes stop_codon:yes gene_type:complete